MLDVADTYLVDLIKADRTHRRCYIARLCPLKSQVAPARLRKHSKVVMLRFRSLDANTQNVLIPEDLHIIWHNDGGNGDREVLPSLYHNCIYPLI